MKQTLYIQPMTARDAAFAEGRARGREEGYREGLRAAATSVGNTASTVAGHGDISNNIADYLTSVAVRLRSLAGEP